MPPKTVGAGRRNIPIRSSLAAWYRFRTGITITGGGVSAWRDFSGNGRDLAQATAASRPTLTGDGSISFDGSNDYLQATFTLAQPATLYLCVQQLTWTSGDILFDGVTADARVAQNTSSPGLAANAGSGLTVDNTIPVGRYGVLAFVANATASRYQAGSGGPAVLTSGDAGTNAFGGLTLGASRTPGNYANILVREVAMYSVAHDAPTRLALLRYMARVGQVGGI